jgi:hypothetical protein
MYKATDKFKTLSRDNAHQGLTRKDFDKLLDGGKVSSVPKALITGKYVKKVEAKHGSTS